MMHSMRRYVGRNKLDAVPLLKQQGSGRTDAEDESDWDSDDAEGADVACRELDDDDQESPEHIPRSLSLTGLSDLLKIPTIWNHKERSSLGALASSRLPDDGDSKPSPQKICKTPTTRKSLCLSPPSALASATASKECESASQGSRVKGKRSSVATQPKPKETGETTVGQSSRVVGENHAPTVSAKQPRIPRDISFIDDAQPVSPLRSPRPAVKLQRSSASKAAARSNSICKVGEPNKNKSFNSAKRDWIRSKSSGRQYGDSPSVGNESDTSSCVRRRSDPPGVIPAVKSQRSSGYGVATRNNNSCKGELNNDKSFNSSKSDLIRSKSFGLQYGDSSSVGNESDTSSCVRRRSDPPGVMKRSSSRNSIFLLFKDLNLVDDDDDDDDALLSHLSSTGSRWSDSQSVSIFSRQSGFDDQSLSSMASDTSSELEKTFTFNFEIAVRSMHRRPCHSEIEGHVFETAESPKQSPTRRYSVENGDLADMWRRINNSAKDLLPKNLLIEIEDEPSSSSSSSSSSEDEFDVSTVYEDERREDEAPVSHVPGIGSYLTVEANQNIALKSPMRQRANSIETAALRRAASMLDTDSSSISGHDNGSLSPTRCSLSSPNVLETLNESLIDRSKAVRDEEEDSSEQSSVVSSYLHATNIFKQNDGPVISNRALFSLPGSPPRIFLAAESVDDFKRIESFEGKTFSELLTSSNSSPNVSPMRSLLTCDLQPLHLKQRVPKSARKITAREKELQ